MHGRWRLPYQDVVPHVPSEWYGEAQRRCEAACKPSGDAGSAAGEGGATYHCWSAGCGCRCACAPWRLRRAADGLEGNLELLSSNGLALQRIVGAHRLAYAAVLHERRAGQVIEAEALDGAVKLRAKKTCKQVVRE